MAPLVEHDLFGDDPAGRARFRAVVRSHYARAGRRMPWRDHPEPYAVLVSEVMLQQTQVPRVMEHFPRFVDRFPTIEALAGVRLAEVIAAWSGLGYNRRARYLHATAGVIVAEHGGRVPDDPAVLVTLPGIGKNTAGSIAAFAYNRPVVFIETNIRRVYIHHFFPGEEEVHDRDLLPLIERTLDHHNPREWYWALMDYGVALAKRVPNPNRRSRHYTRQAPFEGSDRQLRGMILRLLTTRGALIAHEIPAATGFPPERVAPVLSRMEREAIIAQRDDRWIIAD